GRMDILGEGTQPGEFTATIDSIRITGYTDRVGTDVFNYKLSLDRARHVKDPIVAWVRGLRPEGIRIMGLGKRSPTGFGDSADRRVSVIFFHHHSTDTVRAEEPPPKVPDTMAVSSSDSLRKAGVDTIITPRNLHFVADEAILTPEAREAVPGLMRFLKVY